jgi:ubiquinone/menaquinone biosynthesis C-methylase UbiE
MQSNWTLKDEIREYWSKRSETFDLSPGHEIFSDDERGAWHRLIRRHLGEGKGRAVLDLASGTGVISRLLSETGFKVTGLDFSEAMLERARRKHKALNSGATFLIGDAEDTRQPDDHFDAITTRHLVWTLPDPRSAFADWLRVLKPGGTVLIVDADMAARTLAQRAGRKVAGWLKAISRNPASTHGIDRAVHNRILERVHFAKGARAEDVAALLAEAGFADIVIDRDHRAIRKAQGRHMPLHQRIDRASQDRYAIRASKPLQPAASAHAHGTGRAKVGLAAAG